MKPLSFKSLKQMLDALRTEEECKGYLEALRRNGKPELRRNARDTWRLCAGMASRFARIAVLCRKDITSSRRAEISKVCISAVTARNVLR